MPDLGAYLSRCKSSSTLVPLVVVFQPRVLGVEWAGTCWLEEGMALILASPGLGAYPSRRKSNSTPIPALPLLLAVRVAADEGRGMDPCCVSPRYSRPPRIVDVHCVVVSTRALAPNGALWGFGR